MDKGNTNRANRPITSDISVANGPVFRPLAAANKVGGLPSPVNHLQHP